MSCPKWFKYGDRLQQAETDPDGHLNLEQLAATLGLDPKTVQLDGVLKAYSSSGYTFTAIQGGDDRGSAIIVTGNPATGASGAGLQAVLANSVKEGVALGLTDLLDNEDSDVLPRLARRLKHMMNEITGTASKVGSTEMMTILERLQFTTLRSLQLPCCLIVADFDGEVAAYRWKKGEADATEVKRAAKWLQQHLAVPGVSVVAVTNTAWLYAVWRQEAVSLKGSKTDYLFMPTNIARLLPQPPQQPSEAHLLEVLRHILAVYEAKTSKHVEAKGVVSVWPQAVAEALVLNHMMEFEAGIERSVPVFGGDLNEHIIVHYADKKTLHVAMSSKAEDGKRIAVGCMRQLLSSGLGTPGAAAADEQMTDPDEPGPSGAGDGPHRGGELERRQPGHADQRPFGRQGAAGMLTRSGRRGAGPGADAATPCHQGANSCRVSTETESLYHEALMKLLASPDGYEAIGLPGPPHTLRHNTVADWLADMEVLHVCP